MLCGSMKPTRILVTGGGRGIGRAIALAFARQGAHVAIAGRTGQELDQVVAEIEAAGGKGLAVQMDVSEYGSVEAGVYRAVEWNGGVLDVVVNNAGIFAMKPFEETDPGLWRRMLDTNLGGPYYVLREALDALRASERAHVFNIASVAAREPYEGCTAYCATKYGLRGLSDALRLELAPKGVRVSSVYPGATDTSIFDGVPGDWDRSTMNKPEDVAAVVLAAYAAPAGTNVDDLEVPAPRVA
jgi:NAD(P)-dependent dehydrogenase (short-subunit alcohol dehydrogenase family)